jgi:hypothetical protein
MKTHRRFCADFTCNSQVALTDLQPSGFFVLESLMRWNRDILKQASLQEHLG